MGVLKYEIRKFAMNFSKNVVKEENKDRKIFRKKLKIFEKSLTNFQANHNYVNKNFEIYIPKKVNGIINRSKCNWYENGEESTKFFLNLEKHCTT